MDYKMYEPFTAVIDKIENSINKISLDNHLLIFNLYFIISFFPNSFYGNIDIVYRTTCIYIFCVGTYTTLF